MPLFPKVILEWQEPRVITKQRDQQNSLKWRWWQGPMWIGITIAGMMPIWYLAKLNPHKSPPPVQHAIASAAFLGVFLTYIVPWMIRLFPVCIRLTEQKMMLFRGNQGSVFLWSNIASFEFSEVEGFKVLRLVLKQGRDTTVGVDKIIPLEKLEEFLIGKGISRAC